MPFLFALCILPRLVSGRSGDSVTHCLQLDEQTFKDQTVGLVTRDKFLHMKNTIQERKEAEAAQAKRKLDQQQEQVQAQAAARFGVQPCGICSLSRFALQQRSESA